MTRIGTTENSESLPRYPESRMGLKTRRYQPILLDPERLPVCNRTLYITKEQYPNLQAKTSPKCSFSITENSVADPDPVPF